MYASYNSIVELIYQTSPTDEIFDQHTNDQANQDAEEGKEPKKHQSIHGPVQKKRGKSAAIFIDEQIIIPGLVYHTWLQDTSDIVSPKGGRKRKRSNLLPNVKLMELPPIVLICGPIDTGNNQVHYPKPLLELRNRNTLPPPPSGNIPSPELPRPSSPPNNGFYNDQGGFSFEDFNSGFGSGSFTVPMENPRATNIKDVSTAISREEILITVQDPLRSLTLFQKIIADPARKGHILQLQAVAMDLKQYLNLWEDIGKSNSKLAIINEMISLSKLHLRKLNYQSLLLLLTTLQMLLKVLATRAFVSVEQKLAYGDILISRGAKM